MKRTYSPPKYILFILKSFLLYLFLIVLTGVFGFLAWKIITAKEVQFFLVALFIGLAGFCLIVLSFFTRAFIWFLFGREIIEIKEGYLIVKRFAAIGFKGHKVKLNNIQGIRKAPQPRDRTYAHGILNLFSFMGTKSLSPRQNFFLALTPIYAPVLGGRVMIDTDKETIQIGNLIKEEEANALIDVLKKEVPVPLKKEEIILQSDAIKIEKDHDDTIIKIYHPRRYGIAFGVFCWWLCWGVGVFAVVKHVFTVEQVTSKDVLAMSLVFLVDVFVLGLIIYLLFSYEKITVNKSGVMITKKFTLYPTKKFDIEDISQLDVEDVQWLVRHVGVRSGSNTNNLYSIQPGPSMYITNQKDKVYRFGKGLSRSEANYVKQEMNKAVE